MPLDSFLGMWSNEEVRVLRGVNNEVYSSFSSFSNHEKDVLGVLDYMVWMICPFPSKNLWQWSYNPSFLVMDSWRSPHISDYRGIFFGNYDKNLTWIIHQVEMENFRWNSVTVQKIPQAMSKRKICRQNRQNDKRDARHRFFLLLLESNWVLCYSC